MVAKLSDDLRREIEQYGDQPIEIVDPTTNKVYVLIAREQFEQLKPLFEENALSEQEQRALLRKAGDRAGWNDPEMDAYDNYDEHRSANT